MGSMWMGYYKVYTESLEGLHFWYGEHFGLGVWSCTVH